MIMGSSDRRLKALSLAASMKRRMSKEDPVPSPRELIEYAAELDHWVYHGGKDASTTQSTRR